MQETRLEIYFEDVNGNLITTRCCSVAEVVDQCTNGEHILLDDVYGGKLVNKHERAMQSYTVDDLQELIDGFVEDQKEPYDERAEHGTYH